MCCFFLEDSRVQKWVNVLTSFKSSNVNFENLANLVVSNDHTERESICPYEQ
ncbi:hypothetical protein C0J52_01860 [Blattella germanica]|nr:hypothetical protein C0J52_01860 [Blattella germanica]